MFARCPVSYGRASWILARGQRRHSARTKGQYNPADKAGFASCSLGTDKAPARGESSQHLGEPLEPFTYGKKNLEGFGLVNSHTCRCGVAQSQGLKGLGELVGFYQSG